MIIGPAAFGHRFREISAKREKKEGPLLTTLVRTCLQPSLRDVVRVQIPGVPHVAKDQHRRSHVYWPGRFDDVLLLFYRCLMCCAGASEIQMKC